MSWNLSNELPDVGRLVDLLVALGHLEVRAVGPEVDAVEIAVELFAEDIGIDAELRVEAAEGYRRGRSEMSAVLRLVVRRLGSQETRVVPRAGDSSARAASGRDEGSSGKCGAALRRRGGAVGVLVGV
jgi:hypothetical protein